MSNNDLTELINTLDGMIIDTIDSGSGTYNFSSGSANIPLTEKLNSITSLTFNANFAYYDPSRTTFTLANDGMSMNVVIRNTSGTVITSNSVSCTWSLVGKKELHLT